MVTHTIRTNSNNIYLAATFLYWHALVININLAAYSTGKEKNNVVYRETCVLRNTLGSGKMS